jgi:hypothetical protein
MGKPLRALALLSAAAALPGVGTLRVASAVKDTETITIGSHVFEVDFDTTPTITAGRYRINLSAAASIARAVATLTLSGNAVADETFTVAGRTYTFKATPTAANEVKVGSNAADSILNIVAAVNGAAGAGTLYGTGTVTHATVTAADGSGDTVVFTAITPGTGGNAFGSTEAMTNGAFGGATFAGGTDASAADAVDAIVAAIGANQAGVAAVEIGSNEILVYSVADNMKAAATTETLSGTNNAWGAATLEGGVNVNEDDLPKTILAKRAANAQDVALGSMHFVFPFNPSIAFPQLRTSAGVFKAWDGAVTITGNRVTLNNAGSSDWAATDVMHLLVA